MSVLSDELFDIAACLDALTTQGEAAVIEDPLKKLESVASEVGKAWSGSWLGYQSRVYYRDLKPVPPGAHFSIQHGPQGGLPFSSTTGDWAEYDFNQVCEVIDTKAGDPDLDPAEEYAKRARSTVDENRASVLSILTSALAQREDPFLESLKESAEKVKVYDATEYTSALAPSGEFLTQDYIAAGQGQQSPPHISVIAQVLSLRSPRFASQELAKISRRAASHLNRLEEQVISSQHVGTRIFIGHGRSNVWKDLKEFIYERLSLPYEEFNRESIAGVPNTVRLSKMLDNAAFAFIVMTAEDEQADGKQQARMNVIHEVGLFQGRLGFEKAIVLREEDCEQFSNIEGLGQIPFPKDNILAKVEDIRRVLEREGIIEP